MVPPLRTQGPVALLSVRVLPELSMMPARLTVPPERLKVPRPAMVTEPPRLTVELVALTVPPFDHAAVGQQHDVSGRRLYLCLVEETVAGLGERSSVHVEQYGIET